MDIGSLLLGLALLVVIAFVVARPLLEHTGQSERQANPADQLVANRERVLTQLRDLDFDHAMSKINEVDYAAQRAQLVAEGVAILKQLDGLGINANRSEAAPADAIEAALAQLRARRAMPLPAAAAATTAEPRRNLDAEIEATVAQRRSAASARPAAAKVDANEKPAAAEKLACVQCGTEVLLNDRFCPKCGSPLTIACSHCGRVSRVGDQFCAHCGQSLPAPAAGLRQAKVQS